MPSLTDIVAGLVAAPRPVLCLDTCDILEVVQCLDWDKPYRARDSGCVTAADYILSTVKSKPNKALVVVTELVVTEWNQNIDDLRNNAIRFLTQVDEVVRQTHQAAAPMKTALPGFTDLSASALVDDLVRLSKDLLDQATRIDLEASRINLALQRVLTKCRPSHDGHIKDSIHFEHYLELARQLRAAGFTGECVFVSKNRRDFWNGQHPSIHPDLAPEVADPAVQIRFFGSLEAAIGYLRL